MPATQLTLDIPPGTAVTIAAAPQNQSCFLAADRGQKASAVAAGKFTSAPHSASLILGGTPIRVGADGLVSLTDLYKAAGSPKSKQPAQWLRLPGTKQIIDFARRTLKVGKSHNDILRSERGGRTPGAWAHWQIALTYAEYLSPAFQFEVNEAYRRFSAEQAHPELAVERAFDRWSERGHSSEWIAGRTQGVVARKAFTRTLAQSGVRGDGYRQATNAIYTPLFGGGADHIRTRRGLKPSAPLRDHLSLTELAAIHLAECVSADEIKAKKARGNAACAQVCEQSSRRIAHALPRRCA
jgi:hypothetical protein